MVPATQLVPTPSDYTPTAQQSLPQGCEFFVGCVPRVVVEKITVNIDALLETTLALQFRTFPGLVRQSFEHDNLFRSGQGRREARKHTHIDLLPNRHDTALLVWPERHASHPIPSTTTTSNGRATFKTVLSGRRIGTSAKYWRRAQLANATLMNIKRVGVFCGSSVG